jgi:nucleoside-diphosphate-sugar epimerase
MKVLLTGGAGYIGSILSMTLLESGHDVTVIDNFSRGGNSLATCCFAENFEVVRGDVRDYELMRTLVPEHDAIIPLAAIVGAPACDADTIAAHTINVGAIHTIGILMESHQKMVIPISNSGYGIGDKGECTEDSPLRPVSLYGRTKVEAEKFALAHGAVSLRFATLFGMSPRMRYDLLVNEFVREAVQKRFIGLFEANFRRNYLHVRDAALAFIWALDHYDEMKGKAYNVGLSDANLTKRQLCERIQKYLPNLVISEDNRGQDPDKRDYIVSNARIEATGYKPVFSLDDGIVEMIKGCRTLAIPADRNA